MKARTNGRLTPLSTGVAGSVTVMLVWVLGQVGVEVPVEVAAALGTVIAAIPAVYDRLVNQKKRVAASE